MKQGIYKKYIGTFITILLICTSLLGLALLFFSAQNFSDEKALDLKSAAEKMRAVTLENAKVVNGSIFFTRAARESFDEAAAKLGVVSFISNETGGVVLCSEENCTHESPVSGKVLKAADAHGFYIGTNIFNNFNNVRGGYTVCVPLALEGARCYVFINSPITPLFTFLGNLLVTFLISSAVMLAASFVIIYYATRQLAEPLAEIGAMAKRFGKGDFSARVKVEGDDEIAQLSRSFNQMADSLCEFEQNRRSFVANVSHELRTPMTTIGGYVDGILDGTIPPERQEHYLSIVSEEVKRLSRLSSSLLDVSRMEDEEYAAHLVSVNAWDVALSVLYSAERRIIEKGISVSDLKVCSRNVMCDSDMLYQVFYNLLDNAIKFTPEGGGISVTIEPLAEKPEETRIRIRNTGEGVPPEELARIFDRFYKTDKSRSLDRGGAGLGLYIVKSLVNKMGGRVSAESEIGKWTAFNVFLNTGEQADKKTRGKIQILSFPTRAAKNESARMNENKKAKSSTARPKGALGNKSTLSKLLDSFKKQK